MTLTPIFDDLVEEFRGRFALDENSVWTQPVTDDPQIKAPGKDNDDD